jgi:hypothetical protein
MGLQRARKAPRSALQKEGEGKDPENQLRLEVQSDGSFGNYRECYGSNTSRPLGIAGLMREEEQHVSHYEVELNLGTEKKNEELFSTAPQSALRKVSAVLATEAALFLLLTSLLLFRTGRRAAEALLESFSQNSSYGVITDYRRRDTMESGDSSPGAGPFPSSLAMPQTFPQTFSQTIPQTMPQATPQTIPQMMVRMPLPLPGSAGAPTFDGNDVTEFLDRFEEMCIDYGVSCADMLSKLPRYCSHAIEITLRSLPEWIDREWDSLKKAMLTEYKDYDTR